MANIVMASVVAITLTALTPLVYYTPNCILASVIITAVLSVVDVNAAWLIWKIDKGDFLACMGAFFGTLFVSVEIGLLVAVSFWHTLHCPVFSSSRNASYYDSHF